MEFSRSSKLHEPKHYISKGNWWNDCFETKIFVLWWWSSLSKMFFSSTALIRKFFYDLDLNSNTNKISLLSTSSEWGISWKHPILILISTETKPHPIEAKTLITWYRSLSRRPSTPKPSVYDSIIKQPSPTWKTSFTGSWPFVLHCKICTQTTKGSRYVHTIYTRISTLK